MLIFAKICYKKLLKCKRDFIVRLKIGRGPSRIQNKLQIIFNIKKQNPILAQNKSLMQKQNYKKHHIFYNEGNRTRYLLQPLLKLNISSSSPVLCTFLNISEQKTYILAIRKNKVFSSTWFSIISHFQFYFIFERNTYLKHWGWPIWRFFRFFEGLWSQQCRKSVFHDRSLLGLKPFPTPL